MSCRGILCSGEREESGLARVDWIGLDLVTTFAMVLVDIEALIIGQFLAWSCCCPRRMKP